MLNFTNIIRLFSMTSSNGLIILFKLFSRRKKLNLKMHLKRINTPFHYIPLPPSKLL